MGLPRARWRRWRPSIRCLAIYPDPNHTLLRARAGRYTGQPLERIICSSGSGELIDLLMRALLQPGDTIVDLPADLRDVRVRRRHLGGAGDQVPRDDEFAHRRRGDGRGGRASTAPR